MRSRGRRSEPGCYDILNRSAVQPAAEVAPVDLEELPAAEKMEHENCADFEYQQSRDPAQP